MGGQRQPSVGGQQLLDQIGRHGKRPAHIHFFVEAPGYRTRKSTEFALKTNQPGAIAAAAALEKNWKTLNEEGFIIAGSPATVADRLIETAKTLRVGNLHALLQIGSMPHDLTEKNITLFAEEVIPAFAGDRVGGRA